MGLLDNLVNSVNQGIGKAMEKVNAAAHEANAKAEAEGKPLTEARRPQGARRHVLRRRRDGEEGDAGRG